MDWLAQYKHYVAPVLLSAITVSLLKMGIFLTHADLEQSLRKMEGEIRAEYATRRDIEDIKFLLNRLDDKFTRLEDRFNQTAKESRHDR